MFESVVATLLNRFLGSYIENFDTKQLNIGIWSGDVRLKNLRLKKESLDKFKLPVDVKFGHLGELTLQIPWSNLKGKPVKVIIEDVYLLASPIIINEFDPDEDAAREQKLKQEKLQDLEALQSALTSNMGAAGGKNEGASNESFTESLVTKIVDNLQVTIKHIHIRYEDEGVLTESPYALGLTLEELSAVSTDLNWNPSFISITQSLTRKLLMLKNFSCYMNTEMISILSENPDEVLAALKASFVSDSKQQHQHLLKPVSGEGRLTVYKTGATESHPHVNTELYFDEFGIEFDSSQYRDILWTASRLHWYQKTWKFRKYRPRVPVDEDPKQWFRYTIKSILGEIHERNYKWSWEYFKKRRDQRKRYIVLWKSKLLKKNLSEADNISFEKLEWDLPYEDIRFYRSLARSEIKKENLSAPPSTPQKSSGGGWISSWWYGNKAKETMEAPSEEGGLNVTLTDEQRKALYDTIDFNEDNMLRDAVSIPRDRTTVEVFMTVKKAGISLKPKKLGSNLAEVIVEGCQTQFYQRPDSFLANFQMQELKVEDGTSKTLYKHIVSVKHVHSDLHSSNESFFDASSSLDSNKANPFFKVSFENNPLDGSADSVLLAKLNSMTIFYNAFFIEEIIKFFKPPKIHLDTIGAIMNAAEATMEGLTTQTRLGLQYALEEHKTVNVKLDLQAPLIILPLDPTSWKSPVAILDAGHLSVTSNLVDKATIEEIKAKENYDNEDWGKLKTLMYDQFNLHLQDAQFLVGSTIKDTMEQLHAETSKQSAVMLNNLDIKLNLGISIIPEATNLARFKVGGEIPRIHVAMNDFQYKTVMKLIDTFIPDLDGLEGDDNSVFHAFGQGNDQYKLEDVEDPVNTLTNQRRSDNQQHMFEMDFMVGRVELSLSRCTNAITLEADPFLDLVGDTLNFAFYKTDNDMHLDMTLIDIDVIDHIENSGVAEFEKLISSRNFTETEAITRKKKELFKVDLTRTQRIVEFKGNEIEVFDLDVVVDMSAVKCVVSRMSYLSILNFMLNTFTDPNAEETPADTLKHNDYRDDSIAPQKINVKVNLDSIIVVLNEDDLKLATLQLSTANVRVFVLPEALEVNGSLGALSLHDESNQGSPRDSIFRNLISIEGDNLAEFTYKAFDPAANEEPFDSYIELVTGSSTINFAEDAFGKIINYLNRFAKMKAIYDKARDAAINQANQIDDANKMKINVLIRAPTVRLPKLIDASREDYDVIIAELGELYLKNDFISRDDLTYNVMNAGLRNTRVTSIFHLGDIVQKSQMVDNLDISFDIDYLEDFHENIPTFRIIGNLPELNFHLSEIQLNYLYNLQNKLGVVFTSPGEESSMEAIEADAQNANALMAHDTSMHRAKNAQKITNQPVNKPDLGSPPTSVSSNHIKFDVALRIPRISLTIYNRTAIVSNIDEKRLTSLALNDLRLNFVMKDDENFTSDLIVNAFTISDVRNNSKNKFTEVVPPVQGEKDQFKLNASTGSTGVGDKKTTTVMLTVEEPLVILALDFLFELQAFANKGLQLESILQDLVDDEDEEQRQRSIGECSSHEENVEPPNAITSSVGFSVNILKPSVILLADSTAADSEAFVFKIEQVLITSQNIISLAADSVGLFVKKMDDVEKRLRIIDDFSISFALDSRGSTDTSFLTNIQLSIDPLLMRLSLREIRLALRIANKASELYEEAMGTSVKSSEPEFSISDDFKRRLSQYAPSVVSRFSNESAKRRRRSISNEVIIKGEEFNASFGGARFVLIGDVHELPVLDANMKPFETKVLNWSTDLSAECHFEPYVNIYNYAKSTWEPLVEPWPVSVYAHKTLIPKPSIIVDVVSRTMAQITVSSRSVALLSQVFSSISPDGEGKSRDEIAPYIILNETGLDLEVWTDRGEELNRRVTLVKNNEKIPWAFEDWRVIREQLDTDNEKDNLGLRFLESSYEPVRRINAAGVGEQIFMLNPPIDDVHNRLAAEIVLGDDNVKTIILRSTFKVKNDSESDIIVKIADAKKGIDSEIRVAANEIRSLPINAVFWGSLKIKPHLETNFNWSNETLHWKDLMHHGSAISCSSIGSGASSTFYFQAEVKFDKEEPLARVYPHMTLVISAPLEIENLMPFDFNFRLYDKSSKKDWSGTVKKGQSTFVHVVTLEALLLMSVEPLNCGFEKSEFAIINSTKRSEFKRETLINTRSNAGRNVQLKMYYPKDKVKTNLKVAVYSPYIILNRTGQNLTVLDKASRFNVLESSKALNNLPHMFSFDRDGERLNRALVKISDSVWSAPISFDAIGQTIGLLVQLNNKQTEMNFGVSLGEGEGKYKLTKVVTFSPRYVIKNTLSEPLSLVENGSTKQLLLESGQLMPLYNLHRIDKKSIMLKFEKGGKGWSSPFAIDDIGQIYLKIQKEGQGQSLLKVNIMTENATIFILVENANNQWPYSIRNFTDNELYIYQANPNIDSNGEVVKRDSIYKPIYYKIPAKSVMPYAYDYPNAVVKELIIRVRGRERAINLAEIGNLKPFRLPATERDDQKILDLNVVADGPTQSLVISDYDPGMSLYKLRKAETNSTVNESKQQFEVDEVDDNYYTKIVARFEGIGVSLINTRCQELCYITLRGIELRYNESDLYQNVSAKLKWIQIDNQLYGGIFPIILYPTIVPKSGKEMNSHPSFSGSICKVKDESHGVVFIKYATVLLQEMTMELDEDFLFALLEFSKFPGASWNNLNEDKLCDDNLEIPEPTKLSDASDIYFEALHLQPTLTHLSFVRTERVNVEDRTSSQNTIMFFVNILTMAIGNINDAPINLNALFIENIRVPIPILLESIQKHYGQSFFYQLHKILGSADFLGNPVGLFNNISSGVLDIFYEPYQGFVINDRPQELGIGIAKGGLSFLKKSVFGFSDSFAKVTGSIAKGLSVATMDKAFQERRRLNQRRNKPKHALYGFSSGASSFFESISSGVTGIATAPAEGAATGGANGFFKGLGKGVVGLPTKTAIGLFDLASNVGEGIRNTTTVFDADGLEKVRLPRYVSHDEVIRPYSLREAQGQYWLKSIEGGRFFSDTYLAHLLLSGEEKAIVITFKRMILFSIDTLKVIWVANFDQVKAITLEPTGIHVKLKTKEGPFVPIPEKNNREFLYGKLRVAVDKFNQHAKVIQ